MSAPLTDSAGEPIWGTGYGLRRHLVIERKDHGVWQLGLGFCHSEGNPVHLDKFSDEPHQKGNAAHDTTHGEVVMKLVPCKRCEKALAKTAEIAEAL